MIRIAILSKKQQLFWYVISDVRINCDVMRWLTSNMKILREKKFQLEFRDIKQKSLGEHEIWSYERKSKYLNSNLNLIYKLSFVKVVHHIRLSYSLIRTCNVCGYWEWGEYNQFRCDMIYSVSSIKLYSWGYWKPLKQKVARLSTQKQYRFILF